MKCEAVNFDATEQNIAFCRTFWSTFIFSIRLFSIIFRQKWIIWVFHLMQMQISWKTRFTQCFEKNVSKTGHNRNSTGMNVRTTWFQLLKRIETCNVLFGKRIKTFNLSVSKAEVLAKKQRCHKISSVQFWKTLVNALGYNVNNAQNGRRIEMQ